MAEPLIPIAQVIRNYVTNLTVFPPVEAGPAAFHRYLCGFYPSFARAAQERGIAESEQPKVLERAQKMLWAFGRYGRLSGVPGAEALELGQAAVLEHLKFPRAEELFGTMGALGARVEICTGGEWSPTGKLKTCKAARLRFPAEPALARALAELSATVLASTPKEKPAFERFLRANPQAVLARAVPPLALPPDDPAILANLLGKAAEAWQDLVRCLAEYRDYHPTVEFRSIQHGMWVVNYDNRSGKKDLCGLIVQNGEMTARIILYKELHFRLLDMLDDFGDPIRWAFHHAHYYEEFEHQWLFIPVKSVHDLPGIKRLLVMQAEVLG